MANGSLRHLMNQVLPLFHWGLQGRRRGKPGRTKGSPCQLAVEQFEERCLLSTLQAISLPPANQPPSDSASGTSLHPAVSDDGRYVAFESSASNLVPGQTGEREINVFLLDRSTGEVKLVSHVPNMFSVTPSSGGDSYRPLISGDGRYVAYTTVAPEIEGETPGGFVYTYTNVILYDRVTGQNTIVSHSTASSTTGANLPSALDAMSSDGHYIVFHSIASDLVPNQVTTPPPEGGNYSQLFLFDRLTGTNSLITHAFGQAAVTASPGPLVVNDLPFYGGISVADNGTVAYISQAGNLVDPPTAAGDFNAYLCSPAMPLPINQLISTVSGSPTVGAGGSGTRAVISRGGSTVVYTSTGSNLVEGENNPDHVMNVYRYQLGGGTTLLSGANGSATDSGDEDSGAFGFSLAVSHDGKVIAFASRATDLVSGQSGAGGNVFYYDATGPGLPTLQLLSRVDNSPQAGASGVPELFDTGDSFDDLNLLVDAGSNVLSMSGDGGLVAYLSNAGNIVPNQTGPGGSFNVYLYNRAGGANTLVSGSGGSATAPGNLGSGQPVLSDTGNLLALPSQAFDLLPAGAVDANGSADVFVFTPGGAGLSLVSRAAFQDQITGDSFSTSVSGDGRYTVFTSSAANLLPNQVTANAGQNVFVYDKEANRVTLVNHIPGFPNTTGDAGIGADLGTRPPRNLQPVISADGSFIAFTSLDVNLVPGESFESGGQVIGYNFIYLFDNRPGPTFGKVTLVNHEPGEPSILFPDNFDSPTISADGQFVAFTSAGYGQPRADIQLYDRLHDTVTDIVPPGPVDSGQSTNPSVSDNGRYVAYESNDNVSVFDSHFGTSTLVSHKRDSLTTPANGKSSSVALSHDGSTVAFVSAATDLVNSQTASSFTNVFLYKNDVNGTVSLVSGAGGSATVTGNGNSDSPALSLDGSYVAYRSDATNLSSGQVSGSNVYEFDRQAHTQTLVSHKAGSATTSAAGDSSAPLRDGDGKVVSYVYPVIDDDGHLVSYVSTAGDLIPGQSGASGFKNVFVWTRKVNANVLASGQDGSPTVTGDADSDGPLLTRHSFPGFSSKAHLLPGAGSSSVAFINTLVAVSLSSTTILLGSAAGSLVGNLSVFSLLVGQFVPPSYSLPAGEASNALFALGATAAGLAPLLTQFVASAIGSYAVRVHVDVGLGDDAIVLQVFVAATPPPPPPPSGGGGVAARLVTVKTGRKKKRTRLLVEVTDARTGEKKDAFLSPFQKPAYTHIEVRVADRNGDGFPDAVIVTARKGKRKVTATFPG
jgi:Tol biopolymer transport system component